MYNDDAVFVRAFFPPSLFFFGDVSRNKESGGVLERVTSRWWPPLPPSSSSTHHPHHLLITIITQLRVPCFFFFLAFFSFPPPIRCLRRRRCRSFRSPSARKVFPFLCCQLGSLTGIHSPSRMAAVWVMQKSVKWSDVVSASAQHSKRLRQERKKKTHNDQELIGDWRWFGRMSGVEATRESFGDAQTSAWRPYISHYCLRRGPRSQLTTTESLFSLLRAFKKKKKISWEHRLYMRRVLLKRGRSLVVVVDSAVEEEAQCCITQICACH